MSIAIIGTVFFVYQTLVDVSKRIKCETRSKIIRHLNLRKPKVAVSDTALTVKKDLQKSVKKRFTKGKKRVIRYGLFAGNALLLMAVASYIIINQGKTVSIDSGLNLTQEEAIVDPLDKLSSADIAVNVAQMVRLDQTTAVVNNADTVNSQLDIIPSSEQVVTKPQIVETDIKSIKDLIQYVAVEGDSVDSIANKFGVTSESVRWSNDLSGNTVAVGTELKIPPVNGIVYTVKNDDTVASIAQKYQADEAVITAFNDAEITGLVAGSVIVIPDGRVPAPVVRSVPTYSGFRFGSSAVYGYNGYDFGYCTWYAANKRAAIGKPVPANLGNASTWKVLAQRAGIPVGNVPQKHAVIWTPPRDYYGHVGFVEEVYPDGSVLVSEMNVRGWNVISEKVLTPEQAAIYSYIY